MSIRRLSTQSAFSIYVLLTWVVAAFLVFDGGSCWIFLFPVLACIFWGMFAKTLRDIRMVAKQLKHRRTTYLEPLNMTGVPQEVVPLAEAMNHLLARLKQGWEREQRFAADAAHELRTPLAALKTQAQVALQATDSETCQLALRHVVEGVNRSSHLVQQLLTLTRLMALSEKNMEKMDVSFYQLASEVIARMAPQAIEKNIDIELLPEKDEKFLMKAYAKGLEQLMTNLIDNAIHYNFSGGLITVLLKKTEKRLIFSVTDSGQGVPDELKNRLFDRFFRVSGNEASGSGLGLAIVEQVAHLHHAEVRLHTPASGKGLEVRVIFPLFTQGVTH